MRLEEKNKNAIKHTEHERVHFLGHTEHEDAHTRMRHTCIQECHTKSYYILNFCTELRTDTSCMIVLLASEVVSIHIVRILMTISPKASLDDQSSLCSVCFFSVAFFGNFRVSGPDTEHESVFLFVPDPCMRLAVKRETKKEKSALIGYVENAFFIYKGEKMKWLLFCSFYYLFSLEKVSMGISTAKRDLGSAEATQNGYL